MPPEQSGPRQPEGRWRPEASDPTRRSAPVPEPEKPTRPAQGSGNSGNPPPQGAAPVAGRPVPGPPASGGPSGPHPWERGPDGKHPAPRTGPQPAVAPHTGPQPAVPPHRTGPQSQNPNAQAPQSQAPNAQASNTQPPNAQAPHHTGPQPAVPSHTGPQPAVPPRNAPQQAGPQQAGPQRTGPQPVQQPPRQDGPTERVPVEPRQSAAHANGTGPTATGPTDTEAGHDGASAPRSGAAQVRRRRAGALRLAARACLPALTVDADRHREDRRVLSTPDLAASIVVLGVGDPRTRACVSALVVQALAAYQGSRVLAVDANRSGGLRPYLTESTQDSLNPVLAGLGAAHRGPRPDQPANHRWVRSRLTPGSDVALLAADPSTPGPELAGGEYEFALPRLHRWWPLTVTDLPEPGPNTATERAVATADRVVLVADQDLADTPVRRAWQWLRGLVGESLAAERVVVAEPARGIRAKPRHRAVVGDTVAIEPVAGMPSAPEPSGSVLTSVPEPSVAAAQHVAARCLAPLASREPAAAAGG